MTEIELQHIERLASTVPSGGKVLEVGSFCGRSAWAWAKSIPEDATVHCIDTWFDAPVNTTPWDDPNITTTKLDYFLRFMKDCSNVSWTRANSNKALQTLPPETYDLIFLDGAHENPEFRNDLYFAFPLLKPGGIFCGHDFLAHFHDVVDETVRFAAIHGLAISFAPDSYVWVMQKV